MNALNLYQVKQQPFGFNKTCSAQRQSLLAVLSGVPQGSVLGPILFLIYINDLGIGIKNKVWKFADDTKVFGKVSDPSNHFLLQDDINHLTEWSTDWQMLFNIDKCKVMHFGKKKQEYV